jgi:V-type H+-transporting ATPase subunit d
MVDSPLAAYFQSCLTASDLTELNIEIVRNTLYKAWVDDFSNYCEEVGGVTGDVMKEILQFEADRRVINITINSFGTEACPALFLIAD